MGVILQSHILNDWHGATQGSRFAHIAANSNPDRPGVEWFELLSKEEYDNLPKE